MGKRRVQSWLRAPRVCSLNLNRFDLKHADLDIEQIVAKAAECHASAFRISGISPRGWAYYPSRTVPEAPDLDGRDFLKIAQVACSNHDMALVVDVDARGIDKQHPLSPEGAVKLPDGSLAEFGVPPAYQVCLMGSYRDFLLRAIGEIFTGFKPSGGVVRGLELDHCLCASCCSKFSHLTELEIPHSIDDTADPTVKRYLKWVESETSKLLEEINTQIKGYQPDTSLFLDDFPPTHNAEWHCDGLWLTGSRHRQRGWSLSELAQYASLYPGPVIREISYGVTGTGHEHPAARPTVQVKSEIAQNVTSGCYPDVTNFPIRDFRSLPGVADIFGLIKRSQGAFDYRANDRLNFMLLPQTRGFGNSPNEQSMIVERYGLSSLMDSPAADSAMYSALMRAGLPVNLAINGHYIRQLSDNTVLCLADSKYMDDRTAKVIDSFVKAGGGLIATGETSLYDENGTKRENFALSEVLGADYVETRSNELPTSVFLPGRIPHPVTSPLPSGVALPNTDKYVACRRHQPALALATFSERNEQPKEPLPAILAHSYGKGRVVYFPWLPELASHSQGHRDVGLMFKKAVEWVSHDRIPVEIEAEGSVLVSLFRQPRRLIIQLVNMSADLSQPVDRIFPLNDISVYLNFEKPTKVSNPRALVSGLQFKKEATTQRMQLVLPELKEYEVIMIELGET